MKYKCEYKNTMEVLDIPEVSTDKIMSEGRHRFFVKRMKKRSVMAAAIGGILIALLGGTGVYAATQIYQQTVKSNGKGIFYVNDTPWEPVTDDSVSTYTFYTDEEEFSDSTSEDATVEYLPSETITYSHGIYDETDAGYDFETDEPDTITIFDYTTDDDTSPARSGTYAPGKASNYDNSAYSDKELYGKYGFNQKREFSNFADAEASVPYGIFDAGDEFTYTYHLPLGNSVSSYENSSSCFTGMLSDGGKTVSIQQNHYTTSWDSMTNFSWQELLDEFEYTIASGFTWKVAKTRSDSGTLFHAEAAFTWDDIMADFSGCTEAEVKNILDSVDLSRMME